MFITPIGVYFLYFIFSNPDSHLCIKEDRDAFCPTIGGRPFNDPVCAIYKGDDCDSTTGYCQKTIENGCIACGSESLNVIGYSVGECKQYEHPTAEICTPAQKDASCHTEDNILTCGFRTERRLGGQLVTSRTFSSQCDACSAPKVAFYIPGDCDFITTPGMCEKSQRKIKDCSVSSNPYCAYYRGSGCTEDICRKTVISSCHGCSEEAVLFITEGVCPERIPIDFYTMVKGQQEAEEVEADETPEQLTSSDDDSDKSEVEQEPFSQLSETIISEVAMVKEILLVAPPQEATNDNVSYQGYEISVQTVRTLGFRGTQAPQNLPEEDANTTAPSKDD